LSPHGQKALPRVTPEGLLLRSGFDIFCTQPHRHRAKVIFSDLGATDQLSPIKLVPPHSIA